VSTRRSVLQALFLVVGLYLGLCLLLWVFQGRLIYFPGGPPDVTPAALGLSYEELELVTSDGVHVHGWLVAAPDPAGAVVFCHGNAGNIGHRVLALRAFHDQGLSVLVFDYRGYGRSEGSPDEEGTVLDALAAYDHLAGAAGFDPAAIAAYGESLGCGVAIELARRRSVAALVLESPFTSVPDLGQELYRWLPVRWLARIRYDNAAKIAALDVPVLVVHSPRDDIVPFAHGRRLFELAREPKAFLETGGGHNDGGFVQRREWIERVGAFLRDALAATR